ncbi:MAG: molybdate ABC transporter permease subunit [Actinobacteria bacterium]|nr:molybdate ABC transporter permease subunit [Actinomycetota bacterium]MCG2808301.1 molybdate ABC transporter permease subunit [Coriobacteriia bacterium]
MDTLADIAFPLRLSLQVAAGATLLTAVFGVSLGYLLAIKRFRGKALLDLLVTLPMVLPPVVTGYYLLVLVGRNGVLGRFMRDSFGVQLSITFTWYAAVLAAFVVSMPLTVKTVRAAIESVDRELIDASYTLGRSEFETAWHVILPLARKGIAAGLILSFARALGEFGATIMVAGNIPGRTNTMPLEIYNAVVFGDWGRAGLIVMLFTVISGAFILAANRLVEVRA